MKVLWFEVTEPSHYEYSGMPIGGWQDSLEDIVRQNTKIELCISFATSKNAAPQEIDGVIYRPIYYKYSLYERLVRKYWDVYVEKIIPQAIEIVNEFSPDIIHVFGTEWPFGQIVKYTKIPVVIHIQGSIVPYNNALYPPGYSIRDKIKQSGLNARKIFSYIKDDYNSRNRETWERDTWNCVRNYMGRTNWDKALSEIMHPKCNYFHVEEALRPNFIVQKHLWMGINNKKIRLISTGCSTFWKGPDMMLKTAKILTNLNIDFEWNVAGKIPSDIQMIVERKEKVSFADCKVRFLGFLQSEDLLTLLKTSSLYVHTAYIENSPNSICEAQCVGIPIVSTNVGGISTLVQHNKNGVLVPANDPWQMADAILELFADKERMNAYSRNSQDVALKRHDSKNILSQLLNCYNAIIKSNE